MNTEHGDRYMYALIKHQISPNLYMSFRMIKFAIAAMDSAKIVFIGIYGRVKIGQLVPMIANIVLHRAI